VDAVAAKDWVVYSQPPFGGPATVLEYLSRYTHRVAFSNSRLRALADDQVTFSYRDRRDHNRLKEMTVPAAEFIRRFLLHVTPSGLCRLRHYGFLSNRAKEQRLLRCRLLLGQPETPAAVPSPTGAWLVRLTSADPTRCPRCGQGPMLRVACLPKESGPAGTGPVAANSS
jgi:hypothetical protein